MPDFDLNNIDLNIVPALAVPYIGAFAGTSLTPDSFDSEWYLNLEKPSFQPPNFVFPVAWTILYFGMGLASYIVYKEEDDPNILESYPLSLYVMQLLLNWLWTPILFGTKNLRLVFIESILLWLAVAATAGAFYQVNQIAGLLMVPYVGWVTFALALSYNLAILNPDTK